MIDNITELGVGGIFAILVLQIVFGFVKNRNTKVNGDAAVTRREFEAHKRSVQYADNCGQIVKRIDGRFDDIEKRDEDRMKYQEHRFDVIDSGVADVKKMIKEINS